MLHALAEVKIWLQIVKTFEAILYAADESEAKAAMDAAQQAGAPPPQEHVNRGSFEGLDIAAESIESLNLQQMDYVPQ